MTPCDLKFDLIKKMTTYKVFIDDIYIFPIYDKVFFRRTYRGLYQAPFTACALVAIFLSFRVLWGGGGYPPPGRAKVAQTPGRARVKEPRSLTLQFTNTDALLSIQGILAPH